MPTDLSENHKQALNHYVRGQILEAIKIFESELAISAGSAKDQAILLNNYAAALNKANRFDDAYKAAQKALGLDPRLADAWCNLGNVLTQLQRFPEAVVAYKQCLDIDGFHAIGISNMAMAVDVLGKEELALNLHKMAVKLDPENEQTRTNYALSLLKSGHFEEGFREYEWRWTTYLKRKGMDRPQWKGEPFEGKTLLVTTEGGYGDMLQFCRFLPQITSSPHSGAVCTTVRAPLLRLLRHSFPDQVFTEEKEGSASPPHDLQSSVMSLPFALGTTIDTIPLAGGYLSVPEDIKEVWRKRVEEDLKDPLLLQKKSKKRPLLIGLVWAGAAHSEVRTAELANRRRSTDLGTFAPLAQALPNALFYSLQIGDKADQAGYPPSGMRIIDRTTQIKDFADTAGLIANLDVVVAVDTSTAHLAAGLGKLVIMLSRYDQCWRWMKDRIDTPWYKSMTIYQQKQPFDWSYPINRACRDLKRISNLISS